MQTGRRARQFALWADLHSASARGDSEAENAARWLLVLGVRRFVQSMLRADQQWRADLEHGALLYLAERIHKWDPERAALTTFCSYLLRTFLDRHSDRCLPAPAVDVPRAYLPARRLAAAGVPVAEIAERLTRSEALIRSWIAVRSRSIEAPIGEGITLAEALPARPTDPIRAIQARRAAATVAEAMEALTPRERLIIARRYGINRPPEAAADIAADLGVSRQRIDQICRRARKRMHTTLTKDQTS